VVYFLQEFVNFQDFNSVNQWDFILRWFCYNQEIRQKQMHPFMWNASTTVVFCAFLPMKYITEFLLRYPISSVVVSLADFGIQSRELFR